MHCNTVFSSSLFGYPVEDNHIRIGNRIRFTPFLYSTVHRFLLSAPLFLGPTISRYLYVSGHLAAGDSHSIT